MIDQELPEHSFLGKQICAHARQQDILSVFLAASIQANSGEEILDVGAGVGIASLCLARRIPLIRVIGVEPERESVRWAAKNVHINHLYGRVEILWGDLLRAPPRLAAGTFPHVMATYPFLWEGKGALDLERWVRFCLLMVKPGGSLTFVFQTNILDKVLSFLEGKVGNTRLYPLWPEEKSPAKFILIQGRRNTGGPLRLEAGMTIYTHEGNYTLEATRVLEQGEGIFI